MTNIKNPQEIEIELGQQLHDLRLRQNIHQLELSQRAGIALNAVKNLEKGKGATVTSLVKVLKALGLEEWISSLAPTVSISPLQMLKGKPARQRASRARKAVVLISKSELKDVFLGSFAKFPEDFDIERSKLTLKKTIL